MGHHSDVKQSYKKLQGRLDKYPVGAPKSKELYEILKILYTTEEAEIASLMPMKPATLKEISQRCKKDKKTLTEMLDKMADRGLIVDFESKRHGEKVYFLAPTVVGFFEFSLMRVREDINQKALAELFHKYMYEDFTFARQVFSGKTQLGRALVREETISEGDFSEVLSYEKATEIIKKAKNHSVALCYCRHKAQHLNKVCDKPIEICMSINTGADYFLKHHLARKISTEETLELLKEAKEKELVQICDNVKNEPTFICNCCGCCCGMLTAINKAKIKNAVITSNFIANIDASLCRGCGKCAKICPVSAIEVSVASVSGQAVLDKTICLGCGVCVFSCKFEALSMKKRKQRIITPENVMERVLTMAIERGKLQNFIFDDPDNLSYEFLNRLIGVILNLPPVKRTLLQKEIKSKFVNFLMKMS